jgi:hypothetical protein
MKKPKQIEYLQKFFAPRKARGMAGEIAFNDYLLLTDKTLSQKMFEGAWIITPNKSDAVNPVNYRIAIFVLPHISHSEEELNKFIEKVILDRGHQALFSNLKKSGVGVIVSGAVGNPSSMPDDFMWHNFVYINEKLVAQKENEPFISLTTGRGRANLNHQVWDKDVVERFNKFSEESLLKLTLKQAFYYSYLKLKLKASFIDPYDVDGFLVGFNGNVFPIEIKEKSQTDNGKFGIDAGRILMMMRLCITTDSNALYIIREVDNSESRNIIGYKYITLSDMIMNVSWNLQAGGVGMGGSNTQTIMMTSKAFTDFSVDVLKEEWIEKNCSLTVNVKEKAVEFYTSLEKLLKK